MTFAQPGAACDLQLRAIGVFLCAEGGRDYVRSFVAAGGHVTCLDVLESEEVPEVQCVSGR